jgi:TRAP-type C4-dicarboxylate transport system permease small subunit
MDPIAIYVIVLVFVVGPLLAAGYIWLDRRISRRTGTDQIRLTPIGSYLLVAFVVALGIAVVLRQFYSETAVGTWLRTDGVMPTLVVGCIAVFFAIEALLKWLGVPTTKSRVRSNV